MVKSELDPDGRREFLIVSDKDAFKVSWKWQLDIALA